MLGFLIAEPTLKIQNAYDEWRAKKNFNNDEPLAKENEEYIALSEAARIAYEQLKEAGNSRHVDFVGDSPEEKILEYFSITIRLVTDIYGKHPPSTKLERIDPDVFKRGMITDGGESFKYYNDANIFYKDLSIKSSELAKTIQKLKEQDKRLNNDTWTSIIEAVEYISKHIGMSATNEVDSGYIFLETLNQIRQAGHKDAIKIRGNKEVNRGMPGSNYNSLKTTIRAEYWENMEINPVCIDPDAQEEPQTEPSVLSDYNAQSQPKYFHLEIKRQDMLNRWNQSAIKERGTML